MDFPWKWYLKDLPQPTRGKVFSTFACGGGSSMGYKRAGYEVVGCCEIDPAINKIYRANLYPRHNFLMDLRAFNNLSELPEELHNLDVLDGSPPCTVFSTAGKREKTWGKEKTFREGQAKQTLDDLFFVYLKTVERLKPKVCVAENVTGLVKGNAKGYVNEIVKHFRELGYEVQLFLLNAAFMEVPQKRERVFFVANRCGFPKLRLQFTYKPIPFGQIKSPEGDEIGGDLEVNSLRRLLAKARGGDRKLSDIAERERGKTIGFTTPLIRDGDVAPTITAAGEMIRMPEAKFCTMADYIAMGSFPQDYVFDLEGDMKKARAMAKYMIGMSVPPSMMAHIADEIWNQWLSKA